MGIQNRLCGVIVVLSLLSLESGLRADTVQLSSDAPSTGEDNSYQVNVGDTFTVQVRWLSELTTPSPLGALVAVVGYDGTVLSRPDGAAVMHGSIVPDVTGFSGEYLVSGASGMYEQFFVSSPLGPVIDTNGEFFYFQLKAVTLGTAEIWFEFEGASGSAPDGTLVPLNYDSRLLIEVVDPTAVPLPSAVWGGLGLLVVLGITRVRRRPAF